MLLTIRKTNNEIEEFMRFYMFHVENIFGILVRLKNEGYEGHVTYSNHSCGFYNFSSLGIFLSWLSNNPRTNEGHIEVFIKSLKPLE